MIAFTTISMLTGEMDEFVQWFWILSLMGFGMAYLKSTNPLQSYANEAVLPFYILHQTVLLSIGYFVVRWQIPDVLKWAIIAVVSFAAILLIYEYLVRRWAVMRWLFGMKVRRQPARVVQPIVKSLVEN